MAGLRELKNRLSSVRTTGQLAGAMRTVSAAKYARLNAQSTAYGAYAAACGDMLTLAGSFPSAVPQTAPDAPACLVLLSGNRGLCGGFHAELTSFFEHLYRDAAKPPFLITGGKVAAARCRESGIKVERSFELSDAPASGEIMALSAYVWELYQSGQVCSVTLVSQRFRNMLTQTPAAERLLPAESGTKQECDSETLLLPDAETVYARLAENAFRTAVYALALESAAGAQAATLMSMRSAYDNAQKSAAELETAINRRRQAEVTAGVIETASDIS